MHLRASDILLTHEAVVRAYAEDGQNADEALDWDAAIRWRPEWDKKSYWSCTPLPAAIRPALTAYIRRVGAIGDALLFPHECVGRECRTAKVRADYLLRRAEVAAGLPHLTRGGWHAMRRAWATLRKDLPVQDVMAAGGWRDVTALQKAYQQPESHAVRKVVDIDVAV